MRYETAEISLIGDRDQNQDRVAVATRGSSVMLAVVDGMGGHAEGEKAAAVAAESMTRSFRQAVRKKQPPAEFLGEAVRRAHEAVVDIGAGLPVERKPRATCALAMVQDGQAWWVHVGDSRVYVIRDGNILRRTRDHSHVEVLLREGLITEGEIPGHPMRHFVECCLGGESALPDLSSPASQSLGAGDVVLVCSDGLWSGVSDRVIGTTCDGDGQTAGWLETLSSRALKANAPYGDNTSMAVLRVLAD